MPHGPLIDTHQHPIPDFYKRALASVGILVTLSAFVILYKSYQARGYLQFLGDAARRTQDFRGEMLAPMRERGIHPVCEDFRIPQVGGSHTAPGSLVLVGGSDALLCRPDRLSAC